MGGVSNQEEYAALMKRMEGIYFAPGSIRFADEELASMKPDALADKLYEKALETYSLREAEFTEKVMRELERVVMLRVVDEYWMDHIDAMDELKQGIGLRAYGQHDPVTEYKQQGFEMFEATVHAIQEESVRRLFLLRRRENQEIKRVKVAKEVSATG